MPVYEWKCECGHVEETTHRISEAPALGAVRSCFRCSQSTLKRVASVPQIASERLKREVRGYPYESTALPRQVNPATGKRNGAKAVILSPSHEREVMRGSYDGNQYEKGQLDRHSVASAA